MRTFWIFLIFIRIRHNNLYLMLQNYIQNQRVFQNCSKDLSNTYNKKNINRV